MKKFNKVSKIILAVMFTVGLIGTVSVFAATTPDLGTAGVYSILSSTFTRNVGVTTIVGGDLGYTTLSGSGTHTVSGLTVIVPPAQAGIDQGTALTALNSQGCGFTFADGAIDLATDTTHGPIGVYTPGVYCTGAASAASVGTAGITLNGAGTYIFRIYGALTTVDNSIVKLTNGASSCDVFWTPTSATTLGANTTFIGTVIDDSGITVGNTTNWTGRALAFGGTVTTDTDTISSSCTVSIITPTPSSSSSSGSGVVYGCKDPAATNYNYFSSSNPELCVYAEVAAVVTSTPVVVISAPVVTPTPVAIVPKLPKTGFPDRDNSHWYLNIFYYLLNLVK